MEFPVCHSIACLQSPNNPDQLPDAAVTAMPLWQQAANLIAIIAPLLGVIAAMIALGGVTWLEPTLLIGMYALTMLGITVGYHRLFTHRSFQTNRIIQVLLIVLGSMAAQGSMLQWVATHRRHHRHSDRPGDPHSPHHGGFGIAGLVRGGWHAHIGWMFAPDPSDVGRLAADLRRSKLLRIASALFPLWAILGLLLPAIVGGLAASAWAGAWSGFIWGGLVRMFLVHHLTFSINSACHLWGRRPYLSSDNSRNNIIFGILALGEGWHNNHHAFPTSAKHGLRWWEFDLSYWVIRALASVRLVWNVKLPKRQDLARLMNHSHPVNCGA
jgi:stearoyl-CoA desaturase (delta-9 desaturase)